MRLKNIILAACFLGATTINAQNFEWVKCFGGTSWDFGGAFCIDTDGSFYITGAFQGTADFDPGTETEYRSSVGNRDVFVQKLDASGNFLWVNSFGGTFMDYGTSITIDASGNIYIYGTFQDTIQIDSGEGIANLTSTGSADIFIQKLDSSGNLLWIKSFGGKSLDVSTNMNLDALGNIYTIGYFQDTSDFDPGDGTANLVSEGSNDIFVQKLDSSGNFLWAKSFGSTAYDVGRYICADSFGNVYTTGHFARTVDFDPGTATEFHTSAGGNDIFVQKLDSLGNFLWAKTFGGTADDNCYSVGLDASGNLYTTGYFQGTADFDPGAETANRTSAGNKDSYVQKLDSLGNFLWAKTFGGELLELSTSLSIDALGNIYTTGIFEDTVDFDPGASTDIHKSIGEKDIYIQKLDSLGNFIWAESFGSILFDQGSKIRTDASGNVFTLGYFESTTDFDPGEGTAIRNTSGNYDVFVQKLTQCSPSSGTDKQTACNSYTWIDGNTYTSSNNTATHTLTNTAGCDSVVTLNLTINTVSDLTTSLSGITITAANANATYQWLDCDNNYSIINEETNQTFTATKDGNHAVKLNENGCVDTSACLSITTVSIDELGNNINLLVYPNPAKEMVHITLEQNTNNVELIMTDVQGKVVSRQMHGTLSNTTLEMPNRKGVYFLTIKTEKDQSTIKLIKE